MSLDLIRTGCYVISLSVPRPTGAISHSEFETLNRRVKYLLMYMLRIEDVTNKQSRPEKTIKAVVRQTINREVLTSTALSVRLVFFSYSES